MRYLNYDEYMELGGTVEESAFSKLERLAERRLKSITHCRELKYDKIPTEVKEVIAEFVDLMEEEKETDNLSSYSNGTESFSYNKKTEEEVQKNYYEIAVRTLPTELISQVVDW